jgi:hypothetical protein
MSLDYPNIGFLEEFGIIHNMSLDYPNIDIFL